MRNIHVILALLLVVGSGCNRKTTEKEEVDLSNVKDIPAPKVKTVVVRKQYFEKELASNGTLVALRKVDLSFRANERIKKILFANGDKVKKGDLIAYLDDFEPKMRFEQSKRSYESAKLEFANTLIGKGYDIKDTALIPKELFHIIKLRSGYDQANSDLIQAKYTYDGCRVYSPIDGIIANLFSSEMNFSEHLFCTVIDDNEFIVDFPVMESEIDMVKRKQKVEVSPYYNESITAGGFVREVNPVVGDNGLVTVRAIVRNVDKKLVEGMNVKLTLKQSIPNLLTVPKKAVTKRSEKDVVFTYDDGLAYWNNVVISNENSTHYVIEEGLEEGDTIIVEGNIHLAHLSDVSIDEPKQLKQTNDLTMAASKK